MANIRIRSSSSQLNELTLETPLQENILYFARIIYQKLGSRIQNQTLEREKEPTTYFSKLLNLLDDYDAKFNGTPEFDELNSAIAQLDEYLGGLGELFIYPYQEDFQYTPQWLDPTEPHNIRAVCVYDQGEPINNVVVNNGSGDMVQVVTIHLDTRRK